MKKLLLIFLTFMSGLCVMAEDFTVFLKNSSNWGKPTVWAWNPSTGENCTMKGSWPGDEMTREGDLWKWTAKANTTPTMIIFSNNGGSQTKDLKYVNGATYDCSGTIISGGGGDDPVIPVTPPEGGEFAPGKYLITDYYKVNPDGKVGSNKTIAVGSGQKCGALSHWTDAELICQGVARDVCMAIKGVHERPVIDTYSVYAAYDNANLYLGIQFVYTVYDKYGEGYQPGESKPYNMDGKIMIAFDIDPKKSCDGTLTNGASVWFDKKYTTFDNGMDCLFLGSTKPGVGTPGLFVPNAAGKFDYNDPNSCKDHNVVYGYDDGLLSSIEHIWGQEKFRYDPSALEGNEGFVDLIPQIAELGGKDTDHTFYEFKFPLSDLGINEEYINTYGIGVMVVDIYGSSAHSCNPYDPSMFDNVNESYSQDASTSKEKEDEDLITYGFARIGKLAGDSGVDAIPGDNDRAPVEYFNLQGLRVSNPGHGFFIMRQGNTVKKVIL
ncbi:MAG: starch-binding protein [Muribaculaceae bacterium]|nr:starch-binding protein [Muribaculaceae bacterium]